ncbi:MAG TPA: 50S ribosomal protein L11 methyltransferase [Gemmatimonadaceae bacterium]|nr:50S ribosomal protein L11 methyltransferase [Gemmatimonadaceae bacterium]
MSWIEVRVRCGDSPQRDAIVAALVAAGAAGVQEVDDGLRTHLPQGAELHDVEAAVRAAGSAASISYSDAGEIDWASRWPARVGVQRVARIAVAPPWLADQIADAEIPIVIEPATAFGTGEHETTRGILALMQRTVRAGDVVADLGAGSAVLSIAAAKLGASRVAAVELDAQAMGNAEENVERNGVADRVTIIEGDAAMILPLLAPVRLILANIVSGVIVELGSTMREALTTDGRAIISGILVSERDSVLSALEPLGFELREEIADGDWWSAELAPC